MATSPGKNGLKLSLPTEVTLKDLIAAISVAVTMAMGWGLFSSRLTLIERELVFLQKAEAEHSAALEQLSARVTRNIAHQQEDEVLIDQVFIMLKRQPPVRRAQ